MSNCITFGNQFIILDEVPSTNSYLYDLNTALQLFEGLVVRAKSQTQGKGQRGNLWVAEPNKNLTFSLLLKPNLNIPDQFMLSKVIALGLHDFLLSLNLKDVSIKWPNDIWVGKNKIAGILIENTLKNNKINTAIVGVGLNVNQIHFNESLNATSLQKELNITIDVDTILNELLAFLEKRYLMLKALNYQKINADYLSNLLGYNTELNYIVYNIQQKGIIRGVNSLGLLQLEIDGDLKEFDLKELRLVNF